MTDDQTPKSSEDMLAEIRDWLDESQIEPDPPPAAESPAEEAPTATADVREDPPVRAEPSRTTVQRRPRRVDADDAVVPAQTQRRSSWDGMGPWLLLGMVFAAVGAILLIWGATQFAESGSWKAGTGTVIAVDGSEDGTSVTIEYVVDGRSYVFSSTAEDSTRVGDVFEILVRPDDPSQATTQRDRILAFVLRIVFGVIAAAAALVPIWWGRRLRRVDRY